MRTSITALLRKAGLSRQLIPEILGSQLPGQLVLIGVTTLVTVLVAVASYHFYEQRFLRLKKLFPSGSRAESPGHGMSLVQSTTAGKSS